MRVPGTYRLAASRVVSHSPGYSKSRPGSHGYRPSRLGGPARPRRSQVGHHASRAPAPGRSPDVATRSPGSDRNRGGPRPRLPRPEFLSGSTARETRGARARHRPVPSPNVVSSQSRMRRATASQPWSSIIACAMPGRTSARVRYVRAVASRAPEKAGRNPSCSVAEDQDWEIEARQRRRQVEAQQVEKDERRLGLQPLEIAADLAVPPVVREQGPADRPAVDGVRAQGLHPRQLVMQHRIGQRDAEQGTEQAMGRHGGQQNCGRSRPPVQDLLHDHAAHRVADQDRRARQGRGSPV